MNQKSAMLEFAYCDNLQSVQHRIRWAKRRGRDTELNASMTFTTLRDMVKSRNEFANRPLIDELTASEYDFMRKSLEKFEKSISKRTLLSLILKELHQDTIKIGGASLKRFDDFGKKIEAWRRSARPVCVAPGLRILKDGSWAVNLRTGVEIKSTAKGRNR